MMDREARQFYEAQASFGNGEMRAISSFEIPPTTGEKQHSKVMDRMKSADRTATASKSVRLILEKRKGTAQRPDNPCESGKGRNQGQRHEQPRIQKTHVAE